MNDAQIAAAIKASSSGKSAAQPQDKIRDYLRETDRLLKLPPGTSEKQIQAESAFDPSAVGPETRSGRAKGLAQVIDSTRAAYETRLGRKLDAFNPEDAVLMHRMAMQDNIKKFGNPEDALRAYNSGWDKSRWDNSKTNAYVKNILGNQQSAQPQLPQQKTPVEAYQPFAEVRKDIDPKTLNEDPNWINASKMMYQFWEQKPFQGTDAAAADWGKESLGRFNYDLVSMAQIAKALTNATPQEKQAFLYMMDTYDNTNMSWEGTGRAVKNIATDPTNYASLAGLIPGITAKTATNVTVKAGIRQLLKQGLVRTGVKTGIDTAILSGTAEGVRESVEVSGGRREEIDPLNVAGHAAIGMMGGTVLGTLADAGASKLGKLIGSLKERFKGEPKVLPTEAPEITAAAPRIEPKAPSAEASTLEKIAAGEVPKSAEASTLEKVAEADKGKLTKAEELAAIERKQDGRLPEDSADAVRMGDNVKPVDVPEVNTGLRTTRINGEEVAPFTKEELKSHAATIVDQLRNIETKDLPQALETLRTGDMPLETHRVVAKAMQDFKNELAVEQASLFKEQAALVGKELNEAQGQRLTQITERLNEIEERVGIATRADDAYGSLAGSLLQDRQDAMNALKGVTVEDIMKEHNLSHSEATLVYSDMVLKAADTAEARAVADKFDLLARQAIESGNLTDAAKTTIQKYRTLSTQADLLVPKSSTLMQKLAEATISNVFSAKTVLVNMIPSGLKTLAIPALKFINRNPFSKAEFVEMSAAYSAMRSTFTSAMKSAWAGFKYEQSLLTRDTNKLLEGEMAIGGKLGGYIRLFPRLLAASDEFLARINYNSFIAGRVAGEAMVSGSEKGLKGKALTDSVKAATERALKDAYAPVTGDELVQPILNKGMRLGLQGEELFSYVEREAMKNPEALRKGSDQEALDFVRDVLYKRRFTGTNVASDMALRYEDTMHKYPGLKLFIGQLFFRTPIRIFEEGVRLTPGLQLIAPGFLSDLRGVNGAARQTRAQAEHMASMAVAGAILSLYAQGRLRGDGAYINGAQSKTRTDGPLPEPYTLEMKDGSTWSYRSFDPLSTPVKIIVNALERHDHLRLREAQGELMDEKEYKRPLAAIGVMTSSIAAAIKDASLVEGVANLEKTIKMLAAPEEGENGFLKAVSDRLKTVLPNTLHKIAKTNDPTMKDPATFWQVVETQILNPLQIKSDIKTANAYDALGNKRQMADTGSLWNVFSTATIEERAKGMSHEEQYVLAEMDRLARVTGDMYRTPIKNKQLGDVDLRTILSSDKSKTLYDVWQQEYKNLNPAAALYPIAVSPLPDGTFKTKAAKSAQLHATINELQNAAFNLMMAKEAPVIEKMVKETLEKSEAKSGLRDTPRSY
jgi:hypothetical protein